jgi:deoxyribonuclease (pyrimidine dimer)
MRANVGINPRYLFDQHLLAEYRECPMLIGSLKYYNWQIKSSIPEKLKMGIGYMNFFKVRLKYIQRRHIEVKKEMERRNIKHDLLSIDLTDIPKEFCNDWEPTLEDSKILRARIIQRIGEFPNILWWRYNHTSFDDVNDICRMIDIIREGELFYV